MDRHVLFVRTRYWLAVFLVCFPLWSQQVMAEDILSDDFYGSAETPTVADPLEPLNRKFFYVNDKLYLWVLDPVATGYSKVLPEDIRGCIGNFFYNLSEPVRAVNCILQGRFRDSGRVLSRFLINTVCGIFGLADPAGHEFAIAPVYATFGETLAVWGIGDGFYLVVPVYGPSTLRDFSGAVVDSVAVTTYYPWDEDDVNSYALYGAEKLNTISLHLGEYQQAKSLSLDPYVAFRNGYMQLRRKERSHGKYQSTH